MPKSSLQLRGAGPLCTSSVRSPGAEAPSPFRVLNEFSKKERALWAASWRDVERAGEGGSGHFRADLPHGSTQWAAFDAEMASGETHHRIGLGAYGNLLKQADVQNKLREPIGKAVKETGV